MEVYVLVQTGAEAVDEGDGTDMQLGAVGPVHLMPRTGAAGLQAVSFRTNRIPELLHPSHRSHRCAVPCPAAKRRQLVAAGR